MTSAGPATAAPTPIFVLGLQRSGTTWVGNLLAAHPLVAAVEAADHQGIHESIFFSHFARAFGDLTDDANFARFAAAFTTSDYFLLTGLEPSILYHRRPTGYAATFRLVMDEFARRRGARFWVEKSPHHVLLADRLAAAFPDARFVCVHRNLRDVARSRLGRKASRDAWLRAAATHVLYTRTLERFERRCPRAVRVRYETLRAEPQRTLRRLLSALDLPFRSDLLRPRYAPNTSFPNGDRGRVALGLPERARLAAAITMLHLVPLHLLQAVHARRERRRGLVWPAWCWKRAGAGLPGVPTLEPGPPAAAVPHGGAP